MEKLTRLTWAAMKAATNEQLIEALGWVNVNWKKSITAELVERGVDLASPQPVAVAANPMNPTDSRFFDVQGGRCAECGRKGVLVRDLEDGLLKHINCCDIPPG